ncbi:MarR family winged helix-turn-helix transcriptional regulator [Rugosimonospora africana]|nr:MarR family transcriptional regulator [Rugosimonospora africana]
MQRDEFQTAFWSTKRAMAEAAEAAFNQHGVRAGQQFILERLWETDGQTPGELAKALGLATPTVTRTATRMETAGLLHREAHPSDARLVRLCLTDRGRRLEKTLEQERRRLTERALRGLTDDEREQLVQLLETIRTNLGERK